MGLIPRATSDPATQEVAPWKAAQEPGSLALSVGHQDGVPASGLSLAQPPTIVSI